MKSLWKDRAGSISIYAAMFSILAVGGGALVIDFSRSVVLHHQMQDAADAAAMAGAFHLDGKDGARARATTVALNALQNTSSIPEGGGATQLTVNPADVKFYSQISPNTVDATSDLDAKFMEVGLNSQTVRYMFAPVLNTITSGTETTKSLQSRATARTAPYVCHAPPLMMCDLKEMDEDLDPTHKDNIGRQVRLKAPQSGGGGTWAPGNFGLLALPDGSSGAKDIEGALAAEQPDDCYKLDVITATGSKTVKIKQGINTRFDISTLSDPPAPNVINYPLDTELAADPNEIIGSGNWDIEDYWTKKHSAPVPDELAGASRYQAYLYELGVPFIRDGKATTYPIPDGADLSGAGYIGSQTAEIPTDDDYPSLPDYDGVPQSAAASNGPLRRLVKVALLQCIADGINGHGTYPTYGRYVMMFITQEVRDPPDAAIYGEIVRPLSPINEPTFHANVKLVK